MVLLLFCWYSLELYNNLIWNPTHFIFVDTFDRLMSDVHSPICLDLKNIPVVKTNPLLNQNFEKIQYKSSWKPESKTQYQNCFSQNDIMVHSENILSREFSPNSS